MLGKRLEWGLGQIQIPISLLIILLMNENYYYLNKINN